MKILQLLSLILLGCVSTLQLLSQEVSSNRENPLLEIHSEKSRAPQSLAEFIGVADVNPIAASIVTKGDQQNQVGLSVITEPKDFAGVAIVAPEREFWDFSETANLNVEVENTSDEKISIWASISGRSLVDDEDEASSPVPAAVTLNPGEKGIIHLPLYARGKRLKDNAVINSGNGVPVGSGKLDLSQVSKLSVYVQKSPEVRKFRVVDVSFSGEVETITEEAFIPFVDSMGQYKHEQWPGKVDSVQSMIELGNEEETALEKMSSIPDWNQYGGYLKSPQQEATGNFYAKKINGKWWLVDPEGRLFFSHGVNCLGQTAPTPVDLRENYYDELPGGEPFAECWSVGRWAPHGFYKNHFPYKMFDFLKANLIRKYGENWKVRYRKNSVLRLSKWGINTMGNWTEAYMYEGFPESKMPYTVSGSTGGSKVIEGSTGWWRKFPDPFDPGFATNVRTSLVRFENTAAKDPYCIGFFVDNEQSWKDETTLAESTLISPPGQPAKVVLIEDLKEKYDSIDALNLSWNTEFESWTSLAEITEIPEQDSSAFYNDMLEFNSKLVREYFEICRSEVKRIAPNHMYLGCRFSATMMNNKVLQLISQEYCDVITYNIYNLMPIGFIDEIDKPVLIGEFHFGALDRGVFHTGLWYAKDQNERAERYCDYVEYAIDHPLIIGTHWFQYPAQGPTGRPDGENFQIGFTDICDRPYPELIQTVRKIGETIYQRRLVKIE